MRLLKTGLIILLMLFIGTYSSANNNDNRPVTLKDRFGFHTNALYWALVTPNIGVEFDIIHSDTRKISLFASGKYNWNSDHKVNGYNSNRYVYNIFGAKAEARFYFRTRKREEREIALLKGDNIQGLLNKLSLKKNLLLAKDNPRYYRAYYLAPYVSYDKFTIKLTDTGMQGQAVSAGLSFGYTTPLYLYKGGNAIDFEIGASVGAVYTSYKKFEYNKEDGCQVVKEQKEGHLVPFPVITDLRLGFVYRFKSIDKQITKHNTEKIEQLHRTYKLIGEYKKNVNDFVDPKSPKYISPDSIKKWNKEVEKKNSDVRSINKKYAYADSASLLTELAYAYEVFEIPEKTLIKSQRKKIPNRMVESIRELDISYIDKILEQFAGIKEESGVESVETALTKSYNTLPKEEEEITLLELLKVVVSRINDFSIYPHNQKYFVGNENINRNIEDNKIAKVKINISSQSNTTINNWYSTNNFLNREDTLYIKKTDVYKAVGYNDFIENENTVKRMALIGGYAQTPRANDEHLKEKNNELPTVTENQETDTDTIRTTLQERNEPQTIESETENKDAHNNKNTDDNEDAVMNNAEVAVEEKE